MTFRPWMDPQESLRNLQDEMGQLVQRVWHGGLTTAPFDGQEWAPAIDLVEFHDFYVLTAEVPGIDVKTVEVTHHGNVLTLRGRKARVDRPEPLVRSLRHERRFGAFCRSMELPEDMNPDKLSARFSGGVLEITIPKSASSRPKAVKINISEADANVI